MKLKDIEHLVTDSQSPGSHCQIANVRPLFPRLPAWYIVPAAWHVYYESAISGKSGLIQRLRGSPVEEGVNPERSGNFCVRGWITLRRSSGFMPIYRKRFTDSRENCDVTQLCKARSSSAHSSILIMIFSFCTCIISRGGHGSYPPSWMLIQVSSCR